MNPIHIFNPILQYIITTSDAELLSAEIDQLLVELYDTNADKFSEAFKSNLSAEIAAALRKVLENQGISFSNREEMRKFLLELQKALRALPVLSLTLAFSPSEKFLTKLSSWAKEHMENLVILELSYDPEILGGAVIVSNGHYYDFSLMKKLESIFQTYKDRIIELGK